MATSTHAVRRRKGAIASPNRPLPTVPTRKTVITLGLQFDSALAPAEDPGDRAGEVDRLNRFRKMLLEPG